MKSLVFGCGNPDGRSLCKLKGPTLLTPALGKLPIGLVLLEVDLHSELELSRIEGGG